MSSERSCFLISTKVPNCTQVHDMWPFGPLVNVWYCSQARPANVDSENGYFTRLESAHGHKYLDISC